MDVSLTPELQELVKKKVKSGLYHTAGEVIGEGLRLLDERDRLYEVRLETLRAEIKKGLDSGRSVAGEQVFRELRIKARRRTHEEWKTEDTKQETENRSLAPSGLSSPVLGFRSPVFHS